jgi:phage-related protein
MTIKAVIFVGTALDDLKRFPVTAKREAGHQLDQLQNRRDPDDWKPMPSIGIGVREVRIRDEAGAFRIIYVVKFKDAIYVLHCFQKKSQKTSSADIDIATSRFRYLSKELST